MKLSKRSSSITQSEIRAMSMACRTAGGINLSQGVCDTETPRPVLTGAADALFAGQNSYTRYDGIDEIRSAIAYKEKRDKGVDLDPDGEIIVTGGATGALYSAVMALLDPEDEIVIFEPFYGYHVSTMQSAGIKINFIRLEEQDNWSFTDQQLEAAITDKTKAILINTPGNPSGKVFSREELLRIGAVVEKYDLVLFSDEIYEYFVYEGEHLSPIAIPELRSRTVLIGGFSKTFSITGWRIGYTIAPREITEAIGHLSDLIYVCAPAPLQAGVAQAIMELPEEHYTQLRDEHLEKREILCSALEKAGMNPIVPKGAYYVLADISKIEANTSRERALTFLRNTGIAGVPGSAFYHDNSGDHLIRFCFAKDKHIIEKCAKTISEIIW